jgi:phosphoenolpyruvate carboxykinase (ATP)
LLAAQIAKNGSTAWLVNTGWSGGAYGTGARMSLKHTRAILDGIHDGSLQNAPTVTDEIFGLVVPTKCKNVPDDLLIAKNTWADKAAYDEKAKHLATLFNKNFANFADRASDAIKGAGPNL